MSLPIKPVCKKAFTRKDGTSIIFIQYCQTSETRTLLNSGIAIPPSFWNRKQCKISSELPNQYGNPDDLNEQIRKKIRKIEDLITFGARIKVNNPVELLKKAYNNHTILLPSDLIVEENITTKNNPEVFPQIEDYIVSKTKKVTANMLHVYRNMRDILVSFQIYRKKPITFDSFDFNFYEEFVEYMLYEHIHRRRKTLIKGLRVSSAGKTIKQLRIFLRNRINKKIIPPINLEEYKIIGEEADAIYLTWQEIKQIHNTEMSKYPHLCKYRDLLVFGCLTGLRFSDFTTIKAEDVREGMLYKKQAKSDQWVVIPLRDEAENIFVKEFNKRMPKLSNSNFNSSIKQVVKLAGVNQMITFSHKKGNVDVYTTKPKYEWVTSHTCRRSFCTNEFLAGTPSDLIMKISGHKSVRDFYRYIRITPEEAGRKMKEIWLQRGDISIKR